MNGQQDDHIYLEHITEDLPIRYIAIEKLKNMKSLSTEFVTGSLLKEEHLIYSNKFYCLRYLIKLHKFYGFLNFLFENILVK